jgi:hypothetical protein
MVCSQLENNQVPETRGISPMTPRNRPGWNEKYTQSAENVALKPDLIIAGDWTVPRLS